jgi:hypothetical protein
MIFHPLSSHQLLICNTKTLKARGLAYDVNYPTPINTQKLPISFHEQIPLAIPHVLNRINSAHDLPYPNSYVPQYTERSGVL